MSGGIRNKQLLLIHARRDISGGGVVTSVTLWYNGQDVTTYGGLLLFTGTTYTLTAKDQNGNPLSGGTWASSDATNAPVSSVGLIAPAAGIGGGSITYTDPGGAAGTVLFSVLKTPGAIAYQDLGANYATTSALMANIRSSVGVDSSYNSGLPVPTGSSSALYGDGVGANHFSIDTTTAGRQFMGGGSLMQIIPTTSTTDGLLNVVSSKTFTRFLALQVVRFDPGFTLVGSGGGAAAFKIGNWGSFTPGGRVGPETTNGNSNGGTGGNPGGQFVNGCAMQNGGTVVGGQTAQDLGHITTEFYAGEFWCSLLLYEVRSGNIMSSRWGWWKIGQVPSLSATTTYFPAVEGPMTGGASPSYSPPVPQEFQPTGANYNQVPPYSNLYMAIPLWQVVNGETYGDPFGVLNDTSSPTLTGISGGTVARGDSADSIVLTGTNFTENCHPVFSNTGIYPQSITINSSTQMTVVVAVGPSATTGAGTVSVNNQSSQHTSGTQTVTVT